MIEAGLSRVEGSDVPIYEFRHLTFQEYLAALALVDGRFPGHDKKIRFPDRLAPLAGNSRKEFGNFYQDTITVETWREPIRLALAECNPDDIDDALLAIIEPVEELTARPRAVMAALCLADEPNVANETAKAVLEQLVNQLKDWDGSGKIRTSLDKAAMELSRSSWGKDLQVALLNLFRQNAEINRRAGGLATMVAVAAIPTDLENRQNYFNNLLTLLRSNDETIAIGASLEIMQLAYSDSHVFTCDTADALISQLNKSSASCYAASWALCWLSGGFGNKKGAWVPTPPTSKSYLTDSQRPKHSIRH